MPNFGNINLSETQVSQKGRCFMSNETEVMVDEETLIQEVKKQVIEKWNKTRESIIEVGKILMNAKENQLKGQSWTTLCEKELPFSPRTADRLIVIAKCEYITSGKYDHCLPVSWGTLHAIAVMGETKFKKAVEDNTISPDVTRTTIEQYDLVGNDSGSGSGNGDTDSLMTIGNIRIDKDAFKSNKKINYDAVKVLQGKILDAVNSMSIDATFDFSSFNSKIEDKEQKDREKEMNECIKKTMVTLREKVQDKVLKDPELKEEYLSTPEKKQMYENDFFAVPDLSFVATKVVERFGLPFMENAIEEVELPKKVYDNLMRVVAVSA
jgi:hypothetical protein